MTQSGEIYTFGPFRLEVATRTLSREGEPVTLTSKAFDTLLVLLRHRDRVVEKEELVKFVWPDTFVSDDSLTHSVSVLRRALGDDSAQPVYIATVPRRGYRFLAPVLVEQDAAPGPKTNAISTPPHGGGPTTALYMQHRGGAPPSAASAVHGARGRGSLLAVAALAFRLRLRRAPLGPAAGRHYPLRAGRAAGHVLASGAVVSPDGRHLAFVARQRDTGQAQLWVRPLDSPQARVLPGTEGAFRPFWSPDSQVARLLCRRATEACRSRNQPPQTLAEVGYRPSGGSWSSSGVILFSDRQSRLFAVSETGGDKTAATDLEEGQEVAHQAPFFLPDGREFLYFVAWVHAREDERHISRLTRLGRTRSPAGLLILRRVVCRTWIPALRP